MKDLREEVGTKAGIIAIYLNGNFIKNGFTGKRPYGHANAKWYNIYCEKIILHIAVQCTAYIVIII